MSKPASRLFADLWGVAWRLLLYFAVLIGAALSLSKGASRLLRQLGAHFTHPLGTRPVEELMLGQLVLLVAAGLAIGVMALVDRGGLPPLLPARRVGGAQFLQGLPWGIAAVGATIGGIACFGGYHVSGVALSGSRLAYYGTLWVGAAILNGFAENLALLGYPLLRTARVTGFIPAILVMATLFGAGHLGNSGENPLGLASVFLAAVFLTTAIYLTGDLWLSIGIHAGAVFAEDFLFSAPDSGVVYTGHLLDATLAGPAWLSGGAAGPEGSVVAFPVFAILLVLLWRVYWRRPSRRAGGLGGRAEQK